MKRLKLKYPFRGYESWVMTAATLISPAAGLGALVLSENRNVRYVIPSILIAFILTLALAYLLLNHKNAEEQYLIEQAEEPQWQGLDDWLYTAVKDRYRIPWLEILTVGIMLAVFLIVFTLKSESLAAGILPLMIGGGIILLWIIICAATKRSWSDIDNTAEATVLDAHHTYIVRTYGRGRVYKNEYYVFYTNEGRLVLKKEHSNCNKVFIVKFNGMITYIEYAEKRKYNY